MILETAYLHMKELVDILDDKKPNITLEYQWFERCKQFVKDFKTWTPEIFIYLEGGNIQGASANCSIHFNLWDDDNEKASQLLPNDPLYKERLNDWNEYIKEQTTKGLLKPIF